MKPVDGDAIDLLEESLPLSEEDKVYFDIAKEAFGEGATDDTCIRLARAFRNNSTTRKNQTATLAKEIKEWRKRVNADTIINEDIDKSTLFFKSWQSHLYGEDYYGHLINMESLQSIDHVMLQKEFSVEEMLKHRIKHMEKIQAEKAAVSKAVGRRIYKHIYIFDLKGLGMKHASKKVVDLLKPIFDLGQVYYPESLYRMYLINAPMVFRGVWKIVSAMVDPDTRDKIQVYKGKEQFLEEAVKHGISLDSIPISIGGNHPGRALDDSFEVRKVDAGSIKMNNGSTFSTEIESARIGLTPLTIS